MTKHSKGPGQRGSTHNAGIKQRAATTTSHRGSRVDPSHVVQKQRDTRAKKKSRG